MLTEKAARTDATGSVEEIAVNPWEINSRSVPGSPGEELCHSLPDGKTRYMKNWHDSV